MLEHYFNLKDNNTNIKTELIAGLTTFMACAYIIVINPAILSQAGLNYNAVLTATVLISFLSSFMMGVFAKTPIVLAPGMGLNAFFTFTLMIGMKIEFPVALGIIFWSGIIFILLSVFSIREKIVEAIPSSIRHATACGIGLFIAVIGLINSGFIIDHPATLITYAKLDYKTGTFLIGLIITAILVARRVKGALLLGIVITTLLATTHGRIWGDQISVSYKGLVALPDFSYFFKVDILGALKFSYLSVIFAFFFTDLFDTLSTFIGVSEAAGLVDEEGKPRNLKKALLVDAIATTSSALFGTSSTTSYIESAAGIQAGGRTGLTSAFAGLLFLPFLFLSPMLSMIPSFATAPVLVIVGVFMCSSLGRIQWDRYELAIPAFLAMILIPMSYSITHGIIFGLLSYMCLMLCTGKAKRIHPYLYIINLFAILSLIF